MTQKQAIATIRNLGMTANVKDGEFKINFRNGIEATAYYTNDAQDAVDTAKQMWLSQIAAPGR